MKRFLLILFLAASARAEELPPAQQILAAARAQLPSDPVVMSGTLKEQAPNGFIKKTLSVEMRLDWNASPSTAIYRIRDEKNKFSPESAAIDDFAESKIMTEGNGSTLEIQWLSGGPTFRYLENGAPVAGFNPDAEINAIGVTWSDLSFAFLWNEEAQTLRTGKKIGKDCFVISVPRPENHALLLWVEQKTGRMLGAEEQDANGTTVKIIKVVSVKEFDGLWMVKDLDIIRPGQGGRTSLRVDRVETTE